MITQEIFRNIVLIWIGIAFIMFPVLMKIPAPYGRHSSNTWGPAINNKTGWVIMEIPAIIVFVLFLFIGDGIQSIPVLVFFTLWMVHYLNRTFIYSYRTRTHGKKMPVIIVAFGFIFNIINGFINGYYLGFIHNEYSLEWLTGWQFIGGVLLFFGGMFINQYHDNKLIRLRVNNKTGYFIPQGGLFKYVSCPNFFGEIIEWSGYALMTWSLPALSFFIWSFSNLVPRAHDHHRWYKSHFANYPEKRKRIFPFIY